MLKKRQKSDAPWGVPFLFLKVYKISTLFSNRNHFTFSKGDCPKSYNLHKNSTWKLILMVIGARIFFITEETEIIGNDERARTELYLYGLCRARRRKAKPKTEKAMYSVSNSISGIIMIIMIISFRGKTTTDWPDQTDTYKKEDDCSSSFSVPLLLGGVRGGLPLLLSPPPLWRGQGWLLAPGKGAGSIRI